MESFKQVKKVNQLIFEERLKIHRHQGNLQKGLTFRKQKNTEENKVTAKKSKIDAQLKKNCKTW